VNLKQLTPKHVVLCEVTATGLFKVNQGHRLCTDWKPVCDFLL